MEFLKKIGSWADELFFKSVDSVEEVSEIVKDNEDPTKKTNIKTKKKVKKVVTDGIAVINSTGKALSGLLFLPRIGYYDQLMIPISSSMFKRIWPDTLRATVFHTTDGDGVKNIAKLEGKKKQISAFFSMQSRYMDIGVATQGGVHSVLEMDADVLLSASGDVMSHLDQAGRRYTSISDLKETSRFVKFGAVEKDLQKMFDPLVKKYLKRGEFQENATVWELWRMAERKVDKKTMSLIIKDYMDGMEKVIKKNIDTFSERHVELRKETNNQFIVG